MSSRLLLAQKTAPTQPDAEPKRWAVEDGRSFHAIRGQRQHPTAALKDF
jgi:hypothetical protein